MGICGCLKNVSRPNCGSCCTFHCRDIFTREVLSFLAGLSLSIFLIVAIASPWYTITAVGLPPPLDSLTAIFWWQGMQTFYIPPLNGERELLVSWESMESRMPKDVYMSSMAMGILAWVATQVLLVAIMFGQICKGTSKMFHLLFCGYFKWVVVLIGFTILILVLLSWTIFFIFNQALSDADLCPAKRPFFPDNSNSTLTCQGLWCSGFAGTAKEGTTRYAWGPTAGWVCAMCSTVFIFFILCVSLSVDPWKHHHAYEEIGEKRRGKKKKATRKKSANDIKLARQRSSRLASLDEEDEEEEEERRPIKKGTRSRSEAAMKKSRSFRTDEESDFVGEKRKNRGRR